MLHGEHQSVWTALAKERSEVNPGRQELQLIEHKCHWVLKFVDPSVHLESSCFVCHQLCFTSLEKRHKTLHTLTNTVNSLRALLGSSCSGHYSISGTAAAKCNCLHTVRYWRAWQHLRLWKCSRRLMLEITWNTVMLEICAGIKLCVLVSFEVQQILCDFYLCVFGLDLIQIKHMNI